MIKAIFFDIDGTLIPFGESDFLDSTKYALRKLKEKGIKIIIASGRPWDMVDKLDALCVPFDGYVLLNGQLCLSDGEVVRGITIKKSRLQKAYHYCIEHQINTIFATRYRTYHILEEEYGEAKEFNFPYYDYDTMIDMPVYQIMTEIKKDEVELHNGLMACLKDYKGVRWNDYSEDIIQKDSGKSVGIQALLDYYHIAQDETMAFGDGGNDIDMLEFVKIGIAMDNANDEVKAHADDLTSDQNNDGIYKALVKYGIIEDDYE